MSKYLFEEYLCKCYHPNVVQVFRYFNVYGPYEEHKGSQASPYTQFTKQAVESGVIKVFEGSDNYKRDFVHVDSVVDTHLYTIKNIKHVPSGIYNVGSGIAKSFMDVAKEVATIYNAKIETMPFPEHLKTHYQYYTCADTTKIHSAISRN